MKKLLATLILALAFAGMSARAETVGRVLLAAGDAVAVRAGKALPLAAGMLIEDKDTLRTGAASNLQVRFTDASIMSLRENSELAIEEYRFGGSANGTENAFYKLLKGGLRTVTGLIGRTRHENYRIDSITATIGIRGTHFALMSCQAGSCLNADGSKARDGLYGGVTDGIVAATTKAGEFRFGSGDTFFAASVESPVEKLIGPPVFLSDRLEGQKRGGGKKADSGEGSTASAGSGTGSEETQKGGMQADSRPNTVSVPLPQLQAVTTQNLNPQGSPAVLPPANGWIVVYTSPSFADLIFDDSNPAVFNSANQLLSYSTSSYGSGSLNGGTIVDAGSYTYPYGVTLSWGRWTGNSQIVTSTSATLTGAPLLFGTASGLIQHTNLVQPAGGIVTYASVPGSGPKPVDGGGNTGTITSSSLVLNFTNQNATFNMGVNFAGIGANFTVGGVGARNFSNNGGEFSGSLSGSCVGGGCANPSITTSGFEVGTDGPNGYELAVVGGGFNGTVYGPVVFLNAYQSSGFTPGPASKALAAAYADPTLGGNNTTLAQANGAALTFSGSNLIAFNSSAGPSTFPAGSLNSGAVTETGSVTAVDGSVMQWGRWIAASGPPTVFGSSGTYNPATGVPYVYGDYTGVLPASGTFTYSYAGGPNPVDSLGNVGTFGGGAFSVSFGGTNSISVATPLSMTVNSATYSMSSLCGGSCTFGSQPNFNGASLSGTCVGGICSTGQPAFGVISGQFTGASAGGLAVAGNLGSTNVTFAGAFKR